MMIKSIFKVLTVIIFLFSFTANAQDFVTHKVKETDSVKELANTYHVTTSQIYNLNPDAKKGLKKGAILIIPKVKKVENANVTKQNTVIVKALDTVKPTKIISKYISHKTKRKQTLFGISQKYNVSILDLKKANKFLYTNNLRKGDVLQIPVFQTIKNTAETVTKASTKVNTEVNTTTVKDTLKQQTSTSILKKGLYIVKKSEGIWRIAKNNNTTVQVLEALNPNIKQGLKEGDTLNVPFNKDKTTIVSTVNDATYTVLDAEGFFRIKLKTGLNKQQLEALNPGLNETGLKPGMVLNIGKPNSANPTFAISKESGVVDLSKNLRSTDKKKLAILLPFKLNSIKIDSVSQTNKRLENDRLLSISLDFYSGVEMALESLRKLNINLEAKVYDTNNRESNAMLLAEKLASESVSAVIGPLLPKNFNTFSKRIASANIPVFSPLTKKVNSGSNVYQTRPSAELLVQKITNYIKKDSTANVVIIHDSKHKNDANKLKTIFPNATVLKSNLNKKGKEAFFVYEVNLAKTLKPGNNVVFLETEAEGFVSNVSSILNAKNNAENMTITLATTNMNAAFQDDNVSNYQLSNLSFTFPTMARMYAKNDQVGFIKNYKNTYNETPSEYAVRGFDVTMDVVLRLVTSQNLLSDVTNQMLTEYTENKFMYVKNSYGGFDNHAVYLVKYNDLNIVEIKD